MSELTDIIYRTNRETVVRQVKAGMELFIDITDILKDCDPAGYEIKTFRDDSETIVTIKIKEQ